MEPQKTVTDPEFMASVAAEQKALRQEGALNAAERQGIRQLLVYLSELTAYGETERWQAKTWERAGRVGNRLSNVGKGIITLASVGSILFYAFKTFF